MIKLKWQSELNKTIEFTLYCHNELIADQ